MVYARPVARYRLAQLMAAGATTDILVQSVCGCAYEHVLKAEEIWTMKKLKSLSMMTKMPEVQAKPPAMAYSFAWNLAKAKLPWVLVMPSLTLWAIEVLAPVALGSCDCCRSGWHVAAVNRALWSLLIQQLLKPQLLYDLGLQVKMT